MYICTPDYIILIFSITTVLLYSKKLKDTERSRFVFLFSYCTEIISNSDPWTDVRTEPWHLYDKPWQIPIDDYVPL